MPNNETKIVKSTPTKKDEVDTQLGASKVTIKQVNIAELEAQKKKAAAKKTAGTKKTTAKAADPATDKKVVSKATGKAAPFGTPMPKSKVVGTAMPKNAVPQKKKAEDPKEEVKPVVEDTKVETPVETPVKSEVKTEAPKTE